MMCCTSCSDDNENENVEVSNGGQIEITTSQLSYDKSGQSLEEIEGVTVTSNANWILIGKTDWCTPSVTSGRGNETVTFQLQTNELGESRSATYSFVSGKKAVKLNIIQSANGILEPIQKEFIIGKSGGHVRIPILNNVDYEYEIAEDAKNWITFNYESKSENDFPSFLCFNVSPIADNFYEKRVGVIKLKSANAKDMEVSIVQDCNLFFELKEKAYEMPHEGGKLVIEVKTNTPYEVIIDSNFEKWVTQLTHNNLSTELATETVEFMISAADIYARKYKIIFHSTLGDEEIVIMQAGLEHKYVDIKNEKLRNKLDKEGYLIKQGDKYELTENAVYAKNICVSYAELTTLDGLEAFENIEVLDCSCNRLRNYDFSRFIKLKEVHLSGNPWEEIHLGELNIKSLTIDPKLELFEDGSDDKSWSKDIKIFSNKLERMIADEVWANSIDLTECPSLKYVSCNNPEGSYYGDFFRYINLSSRVENNPNVILNIHERTIIEYK